MTKNTHTPKKTATEHPPAPPRMTSQQVPISEIMVPETRVTAVYDDELRELLKGTMQQMGMINPVVLVKTADGFRLVDGLHRLQEKVAAAETVIDAIVYEGEEKDTLLMNLVLNRTRGKTKASEMVHVIGALYNEYGMDSDAIRDKTGLSREYIEKLIKISQASPSIQELLDQEVIGVGLAFEISRFPALVQQNEVCAKSQIYRYTVKELHDLVDETIKLMEATPEEPVQVAARPPTIHYCEGCKKETDSRHLQPVMLCPDCFGVVWREQQKAATVTAGDTKRQVENHTTPPD